MSHEIEKIDIGFLSGTTTWHGLKQYQCVGNRPVTSDEVFKVVDFPVVKVPTWINGGGDVLTEQPIPSGSFAVIRTDHNMVLAPAVGPRYLATPHRDVWYQINEFLLAEFTTLKVCGTGTMNSGACWFIQMLAEEYYIKGDESPNQLRLSYSQKYGAESHKVYCTTTRIVCNNTRRMALADAAAKKMFSSHKHTKGAVQKINADLELMAQLHLAVQKEQEIMYHLASQQVDSAYIKGFVDAFIPAPPVDASARMVNQFKEAREAVAKVFASGQHMTAGTQTSRYALLNAFTDYVDHHTYSRSEADRWMDSQNGSRADVKDAALAYLVKA